SEVRWIRIGECGRGNCPRIDGRASRLPRARNPVSGTSQSGNAPLQPVKVLLWVTQAVGMIDPQSIDLAFADQLEQQPVGVLEHCQILNAQTRQVVYVEESTVVDLIGSDTP